MDYQWALLILAIASPAIAWWGTTRYFVGKVQQWIDNNEASTREWRAEVSTRLQALEVHFRNTEQAVISTKVDSLVSEVWALRKWKHERAEPYIGAVDALKNRVDQVERTLNKQ